MVAPTKLYHNKLQRVIDHIYQQLDQPLDLNRLADIACMSPYHWHRVYKGIYGESIVSTVRRLRLHRAAGELVNSDREIRQIAKRSGYSSVQSFNRVFNEHYGFPPAKYRLLGSHQYLQLSINPLEQENLAMPQPQVIIKQVEAFNLIALSHQGDYMNIGNAFEKLLGWVGMNGLFANTQRTVGIYYDDPSSVAEVDLRSAACVELIDCEIPALAQEMHRQEIPGGKYAVLQHKGPYADLKSAYQYLYSVWLVNSGTEVADAPCFEVYLNNPREVAPTELLTEIYMPLAS